MPTPTFQTGPKRSKTVIFRSTCFRSQHRYALRLPQGPSRRKPDRCGLQTARKAPRHPHRAVRRADHLPRSRKPHLHAPRPPEPRRRRLRRGLQRILVGVRKLRRVTRRQLSPRRPPFCRHRLPNPANVILVKLQKDSFPEAVLFILILSQTLSRISVIRFQ